MEKFLNEGLFEHNLRRLMIKLKDEGYNEDTAEELDGLDWEITNKRLEIKAECTRETSYPWSPMLVKVRKTVTF